ncbi:hypothetical protein DRQ53_08520 [bacterium]|nr:MAG: hypothetical protein DRQ32_01310 [bacterium]RKZ15621.1 MAG: hypothetical protein DRQ53_08520 [bacterium]
MTLSRSSFFVIVLALAFAACSDSTAPLPGTPPDGSAAFDGSFDPSSTSFLLQRIDDTSPGHQPIHVELIGSNVKIDPAFEAVSVDVAMRNAGGAPLHAPATIWVNRFVPAEVGLVNADFVRDSAGPPGTDDILGTSGFDYSGQLGEDRVLSPDETSQSRTWIFHDPGLASFSFVAEADFGMEPDRPVISGMLFSDDNRNGIRDPDEGPSNSGGITVNMPDGSSVHAAPDETGFYSVRVTDPGLHRVMFTSFLDCVNCICETTPNPLEVLLVPGPDGEPHSFESADFGIYPGPCGDPPPPNPVSMVELTERDPKEIDQDRYQLISAELDGELLHIRVGYSGCSPDHPFTLYAGRPFMESSPVQTWMLLAHDDRDELCKAWFEKTLLFDLGPIQDAHIEDYGEPGIVRIRFRDFEGVETVIMLGSDLVTLTGTVTRVVDDTPVDGGVVIDLQLDNGQRAQLFFGSLFTYPPPPHWRHELYQVIASLEVGDRVRAMGTAVDGGISLRGLRVVEP